MQALRFWLAGTTLLVACGGEPARIARAPAPSPVASASAPRAPASVTSCRALPSTVYGDEPVNFELSGGPSSAALEVRDASGQTLARETVPVPGTWQVRNLGSGDFSLLEAGSGVTCAVTVNRELSRASSIAR